MRQLAAVRSAPVEPSVGRGERHHNEGHGRRLTAAFEALEAFPALAESRNHVLRLFDTGQPSTAELVEAIEGDVALAVTVLRLANQVDTRTRGRVESIVKAVEVLSLEGVRAIATRARTFDFFQRSSIWKGMPERFRLHAIATQKAADRLARELSYGARRGPHSGGARGRRAAGAGSGPRTGGRRPGSPVEPAQDAGQRDRASSL
jgi:hypothetical protein